MRNRDLAARLTATFLAELDEQVRGMNADLLALESGSTDPEVLRSLFRAAHTLKGAARAAGVAPVEQVCHGMETLLARARERGTGCAPEELPPLFAAVDAVAAAGLRMRAGASADAPALPAVLHALQAPRGAAPPPSPGTAPAAPPAPPSAPPGAPGEPRAARAGPAAEPRPPAGTAAGQVRVPSRELDALVAASGELLVAAGAVSALPAALREARSAAARLVEERRRAGRAGPGADPGAWGPPPRPEGTPDALRRLLERLDRLTASAEENARTLRRAVDEVTHLAQGVRMAPFAEPCEGLPRTVRDLAAAAGKEVRLRVQGQEVRADREVWRAVGQAMLHLVRNAVDHGIEPPDARLRAGKPAAGTLTLAASVRSGRLLVTVADDGAGLDVVALRQRLERAGAPAPESDGELVRTLFRGGVSARAQPTLISGRGVGLDSVRAAVEGVRGSVDASWSPGGGTTFRIECPLTLTQVSAVLVRAGSQLFAVPSADVQSMARVRPADVRRASGHALLSTADGPVPLVALSGITGSGPPGAEAAAVVPAVLLRVGPRRLAVAVDELLEEQTLLARPLRGVRNPPPWAAAAAVLGTGRVAVILSAGAVVDAGLDGPGAPPPPADPPRRPRVLVVDDSITTRTLQAGIVEAAGYDVVAAADGEAAWRILADEPVDLVVSDVEMPRMDGFALCEAIRASRRLRQLPVVLVTGLESAEDRARGLQAGADAYIVKSSFDQGELLELIRQRVGAAG